MRLSAPQSNSTSSSSSSRSSSASAHLLAAGVGDENARGKLQEQDGGWQGQEAEGAQEQEEQQAHAQRGAAHDEAIPVAASAAALPSDLRSASTMAPLLATLLHSTPPAPSPPATTHSAHLSPIPANYPASMHHAPTTQTAHSHPPFATSPGPQILSPQSSLAGAVQHTSIPSPTTVPTPPPNPPTAQTPDPQPHPAVPLDTPLGASTPHTHTSTPTHTPLQTIQASPHISTPSIFYPPEDAEDGMATVIHLHSHLSAHRPAAEVWACISVCACAPSFVRKRVPVSLVRACALASRLLALASSIFICFSNDWPMCVHAR